MASLKAQFNSFINKYGHDVTITCRTPELDDNDEEVLDDRDNNVFIETTATVKARIRIMDGSEKMVNNGILQANDGKGLFRLEDADYLSENNELDYTLQGVSYHFQMLKPIPKETHIEVQLKRREI